MQLLKSLVVVSILQMSTIFCIPSLGLASILGTAESFSVLAGSTVTNTGTTTVHGDLGVSPGTAITGGPNVIGTVHSADTVANTAKTDLSTAYTGLAGMGVTTVLDGQNLGGMTLSPGVYSFSSSAQLTGTLTLNAGNANNAFWVFQVGSALTTASSSAVQMVNFGSNGGQDNGLFWQVGSSATLGTSSAFAGNILAHDSITLNTGATIDNGRALAMTGAVTMDSNGISNFSPIAGPGYSGALKFDGAGLVVPAGNVAATPIPPAVFMLGSGLLSLGLAGWRRQKQN